MASLFRQLDEVGKNRSAKFSKIYIRRTDALVIRDRKELDQVLTIVENVLKAVLTSRPFFFCLGVVITL